VESSCKAQEVITVRDLGAATPATDRGDMGWLPKTQIEDVIGCEKIIWTLRIGIELQLMLQWTFFLEPDVSVEVDK
jgi:hypothetical protein